MPDLCQSVPVLDKELMKGRQGYRDHTDQFGNKPGFYPSHSLDPTGWKDSVKSAQFQQSDNFSGEPTRSPSSSLQDSDISLMTNRRRSHSVSSVMYQKVTGTVPSYSVTLYIGESAAPRGRCHSFAMSPDECHPLIGTRNKEFHTGDLKPRKSVFRKFFRKKE
ncbi:hypothetical protein GDO86_018191 [Hymenochirus boettgeri]|uniref:Uncharacterized protein n=1 Tax=Hymenochirus boettgeri TaxID=247094 RepID=A0A8T2IEW0_9PIPI|nr:hypothetical protein GDO86_018191 [Hymenochirus boettgeri]